MRLGGQPVEISLDLPTKPIRPRHMLPVLHVLSNAFVGAAVREVESGGKRVSCRLGCAACCRQNVPLSEAEAYWIQDVVASLPADLRHRIEQRFAGAIERLRAADLHDAFRRREARSDADTLALANAYVELNLDCPFLENEACTIHDRRPMACREYLVTSPAANCFAAEAREVERVPMPVSLSATLANAARASIPLVLALEWAKSHPDASARRAAQEHLQELFARLAAKPAGPG